MSATPGEGQWAKTLEELRELSVDELITQHDDCIRGRGVQPVGVEYYLDELARRDIAARERRMELLTWAILGLTLINVVAVIVSVT